ncbi:MAG TPA: TPM domain-containing protein [Chitinophagaceae bacterium]|jgi:uncharacterized membrane protein|nr:TPM domain-containing protein [Chitinophagaceae bacterium]
MFSFFKKKNFFTAEEQQLIIEAIQNAERMTSGEVRVFVESKCSYMDAIDRAAELFFQLEMQKTDDRNAVLVYVAMKDRQLAVFGDEGIHNKVGNEYWGTEVKKMISNFNRENYAAGIAEVVKDIGTALTKNFPFNNDTDKNELPDDIVFGK